MSENAEHVVAATVNTPSTHLADFLATCGCQLQQVISGPERTPSGSPLRRFVFQCTPKAEEIMVAWKNPPRDTRDWDELTPEEKAIVLNFVTAFSDNLYHFQKRAKED
jgi:hypothetical protein